MSTKKEQSPEKLNQKDFNIIKVAIENMNIQFKDSFTVAHTYNKVKNLMSNKN